MEELLKKYQNIRFSGNVASNKNDSTERTIKMVVNMESTMLMQAALICPKDKLFTSFGQWKCTMLYGFKVGYLICSMVYMQLVNFEPYMFWIQGCISLDWKPLNVLQGFKYGLIWALERFIQHDFGWFWTWLMVWYYFSFILYWWYIVLCCETHNPYG